MESSHDECPTDILIDLNEDDSVPSNVNYKKAPSSSDSQNAMKFMKNKENDYEPKQEKYQCIMDMSPIRLKNECNEPSINLSANSVQVLDGAINDCPTAILIDVPNSSSICSKQHPLVTCNKSDSRLEEMLVKYKSLDDATMKASNCVGGKKNSAIEDSDYLRTFSPKKNELSPPRLRWKTPSPQSMCRISKEACKIIHNLNSSAVFDEDSLLYEEILPIPINFDLDGNSDEETLPNTENSDVCILSSHKSSVSIQTEQDAISTDISKNISDSLSFGTSKAYISSSYQDFVEKSSLVKFDSKIKQSKDSSKCSNTSEELQSPRIQGGSLDKSEMFGFNEETTDVFTENNFPSEDKENIQERKDEKVLPSKTVIMDKATQKKSVSLKEIEKRPKLRNLLNVKNNDNSRYLPSVNKINSTYLNYNSGSNSKELQFHGKQQLKKTTSAELQRIPKEISRSNSFQHNKRESLFSFQQPKSIKQKPSLLSEYKSSSSDAEHSITPMKTPSRRYSVATPFHSTSTKKSTMAPALSRIQTPSIPRFTPQCAGGNRLSFSKSWQQSNKLNSKGFKNQNTIPTSSAVEKPSFCGTYSTKSNKQALNQSISSLSSQVSKISLSTTSKNRFRSKLNLASSLNAGQDKKLARALFPSMSFK